jgi:hypothetical protein
VIPDADQSDRICRLGAMNHVTCLLFVLALGCHNWPTTLFSESKVAWPANLILVAWLGLFGAGLIWFRPPLRELQRLLPPASLIGYVLICFLSIAAADDPSRSVTAAIKIALTVFGVWALFVVGADSSQRWNRLLWTISITATCVVAAALVKKFTGLNDDVWFDSPLKLGTFMAMVVAPSFFFLNSHRFRIVRVWGAAVAWAGLIACGSVWALAGMLVAMIGVSVISPKRRSSGIIVGLLGCVLVGGLAAAGQLPELVSDVRLSEDEGEHLRQRYLEWQAFLNLLEDRAAAGTGIGAINDYRSEYYGALPKRNTIAEFDQNGWLATAAETGLLGLACLCWAFRDGFSSARPGVSWIRHRAALAALIATAIANMGSAIQYNGIFPVFIVFMSMACSVERCSTKTDA